MNVILSGPTATATPVDPYLLALRTALKNTFQASPIITSTAPSDVVRNSRAMDTFSAITVLFQQHIRKDVIRQKLSDPDFSDDSGLSALQAQLLALDEWTTDTSDQ